MDPAPFVAVFGLLMATTIPTPAQEGLLLHWPFGEPRGPEVRDASPNRLHGRTDADRVPSPTGTALRLDGTPRAVVRTDLPEPLRFGKGSWTFLAWYRPDRLAIDSRQNQRRLFAYGPFPEAHLNVDVHGDGRVTTYLCYRGADGRDITAGARSSLAVAEGAWAHIAVVCDREARQVTVYVNGHAESPGALPEAFDGDFSLRGDLTVGSAWQNAQGLVDDVKIFRRPLARDEVRRAFLAAQERYAAATPEPLTAMLLEERLDRAFSDVAAAWGRGDFAGVRERCLALAGDRNLPAHVRSYAHLRAAQSHQAERDPQAAAAEYARVAGNPDYPWVHREEAREVREELLRRIRGLPARGPQASRTRIPEVESFAAEVAVSPQGDDAAEGSVRRPFATFTRARDEIRALRNRGVSGAVLVRVLPGTYPLRTTALTLEARDSGREDAPVVWRAEPPGRAVLYGGRGLGDFGPVTDPMVRRRIPEAARDQVRQTDLRAQGITEFPDLQVRGFGQPTPPSTLEVFQGNRPLTLARWPNRGMVGIRELVEPGSRADGRPSVIGYLDDRHARWVDAPDAWIFGYFHFLWADAALPVGRIDPEARTLATAEPYHYGGRAMDTRQGIQYYAFNLLEELDTPGEWYLDRARGILYLIPLDDAGPAPEIGLLDGPMIRLDGVTNVRFEGLVLDLGRSDGLVARDSSRIVVAGCTVRRFAGTGISMRGGERNVVLSSHVHTVGRRGIEMVGGDRTTLTPANHVVENSRIHTFGRIDRTYTPAIQLEGVGNRVAHNRMHDGPSSAMRIEGNDHEVEFNDFHDLVTESDDQGAIDMFGNPTYRGLVFRHNRFRDIGKTDGGPVVHGQAGIRFDDAISGMTVYGNVFIRSAQGNFGAIQIHAGRDNLIDNNLFVECRHGISGGWNPGNPHWRAARRDPPPPGVLDTPLYRERYPALATMHEAPGVNHGWRNLFVDVANPTGRARGMDLFQNLSLAGPGFVAPEAGDHRFRPGAPALARIAFRPLPLDQIGLYNDRHREGWVD